MRATQEPGGTPNGIPGGYNQETACKCEQFQNIQQNVPLSSDHLECLFQQANCEGNNAAGTLSNYAASSSTSADQSHLISSFLNSTNCGAEGMGFKQFQGLYNKVMSFKEELDLNEIDVNYLLANSEAAIKIREFLIGKSYDANAKIAAKKIIHIQQIGRFYEPYPEAERDAIIAEYGFPDPESYVQYVTWCVILVHQWADTHPGQQPNYGQMTLIALEAYWKTESGAIHTALDIIGLIPAAGEPADLVNGLLYIIEGDGVNAGLSFAATIPIAGWVATGAKFAKIIVKIPSGTITLTSKFINGAIDFGNRADLRQVLEITDQTMDAHHVIPWGKKGNVLVQHAAKADDIPYHMNHAKNGRLGGGFLPPFFKNIPYHMNHAKNGRAVKKFRFDIPDCIHANHPQYDAKVKVLLEAKWNELKGIYGSASAIPVNVASQELRNLQNYIAGIIDANPSVKINDLQF